MRDIQIGGLVSFTTIDYPGKLAAVLFLVGCPLRCTYCSNPHLITPHDGEYDPELVFDWLKSRIGKLEAVVFSGGEALMQGDSTIQYMQRVHSLGFKIGLHTNGFYPSILSHALDTIDWIGLDYKATRKRFSELVGNDIAYDLMSQSLDILIQSQKPFEVRITCDPRYISKDDLLEIITDLHNRGVQTVAIQKYIPHHETGQTPTTSAMREQFFNDEILRDKITAQIPTVIWRNS